MFVCRKHEMAAAAALTREERKAAVTMSTTSIKTNASLDSLVAKLNSAQDKFKDKYNILCRKSMGKEAVYTNACALHEDDKWSNLIFNDKPSAVAWIKKSGTPGKAYYILFENKKITLTRLENTFPKYGRQAIPGNGILPSTISTLKRLTSDFTKIQNLNCCLYIASKQLCFEPTLVVIVF